MEFSTSSLGSVLSTGLDTIKDQQSDVLLFFVGIFVVSLIIGLAWALFQRARRVTTAAVGGGRRKR